MLLKSGDAVEAIWPPQPTERWPRSSAVKYTLGDEAPHNQFQSRACGEEMAEILNAF